MYVRMHSIIAVPFSSVFSKLLSKEINAGRKVALKKGVLFTQGECFFLLKGVEVKRSLESPDLPGYWPVDVVLCLKRNCGVHVYSVSCFHRC